MGEFDAVIEQPDIGTEIEEVEQPQEQEVAEEAPPEQKPGESDGKFSKRFSDWLKTTTANNQDPEVAKFAKYGKDLAFRDSALRELYPNGVNDVREVKAVLDSLQHGELKGVEAIGAIQDEIQNYQQTDELLASGDARVLQLFGDEFNGGLAKLTAPLLERIQQSDPQAYSQAILPHLMSALELSPMVQGLGQISAVLNEQPPQWLTADQKTNWINDKFQKIVNHFNSIATWYDAQTDAVKGQKVAPTNGHAPAPSIDSERQKLDEDVRNHYWKTNITPAVDQYSAKTFNDLFRPYNMRLKLPQEAMDKLKVDFEKRVADKAVQNRQYLQQIQRYRSQKNPDAATVQNFIKVEYDKHAKGVMNEIITERYRPFLGSKASPTPNGAPRVQSPNGTRVVNTKPNPNEIDYPGTPTDWLNTKPDGSKQYRMKDGSIRVYKPNR